MNSHAYDRIPEIVANSVNGAKSIIQRIKTGLIDETWLPLGLRTSIGNEVLSLEEELNDSNLDLRTIAVHIHMLKQHTQLYRDLPKQSETLKQIRILDLFAVDYLPLQENSSTFLKLEEREGYRKAS